MKTSFSLRYRLLLSFVGVTTLVMTGVSFVTFHFAEKIRHDEIDRYYSMQIGHFVNLFELETVNYQNKLRTFIDANQVEITNTFTVGSNIRTESARHTEKEMKAILNGDQKIVTNLFVFSPRTELFSGIDNEDKNLLLILANAGAGTKPVFFLDTLYTGNRTRLILTAPAKTGASQSENGFAGIVLDFSVLIQKLGSMSADSGVFIQFFDQSEKLIFATDSSFLPYMSRSVVDENGEPIDFRTGIHQENSGISNIDDWNNRSLYLYTSQNTPFRIMFSIKDTEQKESVSEISTLLFVFNGVLFVILILLSWYNSNKVILPVTQLTTLIRETSAGTLKLSDLVDKKQDAEFRELGMAFRDFILSTTSVVDGIKQNGIELSGMTEDINGTLSKFSESASTLSAAVAQTTSAMEEMAASSRNISTTTASVVAIARQSQTRALEGMDEFKSFLKKMEEIRSKNDSRSHDIVSLGKKAARITEIMTIINHINEQTKLIAFNAALEASGAGEAGKRFAVVANEIRRLADNVQESTEEIKLMISEIQQSTGELMKGTAEANSSIQSGVNQVKEMVSSMSLFVEESKNTTESSQQISYSTQQQLSAAEEIVTTLHDISLTASQFADMSTDLANTAEKLNSMSVQLVEMSIVSVHK